MTVNSQLSAGSVLGGRYRMLRLLGKGGMGHVYLAEDLKLPGKLWAVKELEPGLADQQIFVKEARLLAECSHPGLAAVTDFFPPDALGTCYLVMEYIRGETLQQVLQRNGGFSWQQAVRVAAELCEVLAYLHEGRPQPIIHRDLKPSNVMLDERGRVRLIDFGTARHYNLGAEADTVHLGTLGFAAPEQLQGKQTDARTDLYAMGAMLYYLLSGGSFWKEERGRQSEANKLPDTVPAKLEAILCMLLESTPSRRYQRAAEVSQELQAGFGQVEKLKEEAKSGPASRSQLVVVGSLTPGAGASFVAVGLSRLLNRRKLQHALVELPGAQADLFQLLFGEKNAPEGYVYVAEAVLGEAEAYKPWRSGLTEWLPLPPGRELPQWGEAETARLLSRLNQPVIIADAGNAWRSTHLAAVWPSASLVLLVCGPSPLHLSRREAVEVWNRLRELKHAGKEVWIVANGWMDFSGKKQWMNALPAEPACIVPQFPAELVLASLWRGELAGDNPAIEPQLASALDPVLRHILARLPAADNRKEPVWRRLKQALGQRK